MHNHNTCLFTCCLFIIVFLLVIEYGKHLNIQKQIIINRYFYSTLQRVFVEEKDNMIVGQLAVSQKVLLI